VNVGLHASCLLLHKEFNQNSNVLTNIIKTPQCLNYMKIRSAEHAEETVIHTINPGQVKTCCCLQFLVCPKWNSFFDDVHKMNRIRSNWLPNCLPELQNHNKMYFDDIWYTNIMPLKATPNAYVLTSYDWWQQYGKCTKLGGGSDISATSQFTVRHLKTSLD
jgi:hypothetical protein